MLDAYLAELYSKLKFNLYKDMCQGMKDDSTLTLPEVFCSELIYAMKQPTVKEFAEFVQISSPNASYKIKNLVAKGYVKKTRSKTDKREYYLDVTDKYLEQYGTAADSAELLSEKIKKRFSQRDLNKFEEMIKVISSELI